MLRDFCCSITQFCTVPNARTDGHAHVRIISIVLDYCGQQCSVFPRLRTRTRVKARGRTAVVVTVAVRGRPSAHVQLRIRTGTCRRALCERGINHNKHRLQQAKRTTNKCQKTCLSCERAYICVGGGLGRASFPAATLILLHETVDFLSYFPF